MSSKYEFDNTRGAIGADKMSDSERDAMLKKFKSSGGKVLNEKELNAQGRQRTDSGRDPNRRGDIVRSAYSGERRRDPASGAPSKKKKSKPQGPQRGMLDLMFLNMRSFLSGVTGLTGSRVKNKFLHFIVKDLQDGLMLINANLNHLFMSDPEALQRSVEKLDEMDPAMIGALNYLYLLYDSSDFHIIEEMLNLNSKADIKLDRIIYPIRSLYLKLYYLMPHRLTAVKATNLLYQLYTKISKNKDESFQIKTKEITKRIKTILDYTFKSYFLLICRDENTVYQLTSPEFQSAIGYDPENTLGQRAAGEKCKILSLIGNKQIDGEELSEEMSENENEENKEEDDPVEEESPIVKTKEYQYGRSLMNQLPPAKLKAKHDPKEYYPFMNDFDKVFLSYMYFKEFDYEYSFILTTKQIRYNINYAHGNKMDYSRILPDIYGESRNVDRAFEEYSVMVNEMKKLEESPTLDYVEQSRRENLIQTKLNSQASVARNIVSQHMNKVVTALATIIADMKEQKNIIDNMDDTITFDGELEGRKKLAGKSVKECITEAYCYSLALKYRTGEGDLYGGQAHMTDKEIMKVFGPSFVPTVTSAEAG